jgi:hypothetical protein
MTISKSPERNTFQADCYVKRCQEDGEEPNEDHLNVYKSIQQQTEEKEANPEWQVDNLEYDLRSTDWMLEKVRSDDVYAQNLYAAICNNDFQKLDTWPILTNKTCSYSWRYAGGIIADMQEKGDYIDWYCSGIRNIDPTPEELADYTEEQLAYHKQSQAYVGEGFVTDEIRNDLQQLGWSVLDNNDN